MLQQQFAATLTARDCKRHLPHPFQVPPGCAQVEIRLHFSPHLVADTTNMLCLTVFDANGFRGAGHRGGHEHSVRIAGDAATPGYWPGPLPAGEWVAQIDTHMIMPGEPLHYTLEINLTEGSVAPTPAITPKAGLATTKGAGWYRGDLHSHTVHSDARQTIDELLQAARDHGLDFIFLTDHNTVSGLAEVEAAGDAALLTAGGTELTTFWGHALVLGGREWVDWRIRPGSGAIAAIAEQAYAQDLLFIIAHPQAVGDPICTGCVWRYPEMMPGNARLVEVWNGTWSSDSYNPQALALWYDWLNQGLRLVATAGTDTHGKDYYTYRPAFNVVYSSALTEQAILRAVGAGRLYLSSGPELRLTAQAEDGERWQIGETADRPVTLTIGWAGSPTGAIVQLIANGRLWTTWPGEGAGAVQWPVTPTQADWIVVELRSTEQELLAVTNPIYLVGAGAELR